MARVIEAAIRKAFDDDDDALVNAVIGILPPEEGQFVEREGMANDLLADLREVMLRRLDPLP